MIQWLKNLFSPPPPPAPVVEEPKLEVGFKDGKIFVKSYNKAFVESIKPTLGDLTDGKTDEQIVQLYVDRENIEHEEPKLDVQHLGITEDGKIKMKLDWNRAFIKHLQDNGISAETEEEAVQQYLQLITANTDKEMGVTGQGLTSDDIEEAFAEINEVTAAELEEARKQAQQFAKQRGRGRRRKPDANA